MNKELKNKWISALRGGAYEQGKSRLRSYDNKGKVTYCCLGVLCCVSGQYLPESPVFEAVSLFSGRALHLLDGDSNANIMLGIMNDRGTSFVDIADYIERNL